MSAEWVDSVDDFNKIPAPDEENENSTPKNNMDMDLEFPLEEEIISNGYLGEIEQVRPSVKEERMVALGILAIALILLVFFGTGVLVSYFQIDLEETVDGEDLTVSE